MKLNKGALKFCAVYICYFAVMSGIALTASDPKGAWFFGQLAVAPGLLFLGLSGLGDFLAGYLKDTWVNSGFFTIPLSLVIVFLIGWATSAVVKLLKFSSKDPSLPVIDPPGWYRR